MANAMTNVAHRTRRPMQGEGQRTHPINAFPQGGGPITIALTKMLNDGLSNDRRCQTYETHLSREIDSILNRLERLQRMRKGQPLPPQLDVKIS
jgi:hypothetical protein